MCGRTSATSSCTTRRPRALEIVAQRGFRRDFLDYIRTVRVDEGSACAGRCGAGAGS